MTLSDRPRSRLRFGAAAVSMIVCVAGVAALASGAHAQATTAHPAIPGPALRVHPDRSWGVVNDPGTFDSSPNRSYSNGQSVPSQVTLTCYYFGAPAGPYGNTLWYQVGSNNYSNWINDHYLDTPGTAADPEPQAPHCPLKAEKGALINVPEFLAENSPPGMGNSPTYAWEDSSYAVHNGDEVALSCYVFGNATGPYGNTLWYWASDEVTDSMGWINDHYLNTPGTAANPQPQMPHC